jgi:hypothetical protein
VWKKATVPEQPKMMKTTEWMEKTEWLAKTERPPQDRRPWMVYVWDRQV